MAQRQSPGRHVAAVKNCRHFSVVTQAAARTFALRIAELGNEFKRGFHNLLQLNHKLKRPSIATNCRGTDPNQTHHPTNQYKASSPTPRR